MGVECSGVVSAIGPQVTDLAIGDRVVALSFGAYATTIRTNAHGCIKIPDEVGFEEASGMPMVYLTKDQTVLIHSACGEVGLAAIYVCRMIGVETIYTTVGSAEKAQFLINTFGFSRSRIFSSLDAGFLPGIMKDTSNRGVDVVLNSLSGELLHASWECVAEFGCMLEVGKRDIQGQGRLALDQFGSNRAFFGIDMCHIRASQPHRFRKLIKQFTGYVAAAALGPIRPMRVFEASDVQAGIRTILEDEHIGKLVLRIPEDASKIAAHPVRQSVSFRPDVSYLLVGGLGGLGRSVATWMVENGARNLIFLSRSGGKRPHEEAWLRGLQECGCTVVVVAGNVANMDTVSQAVSQAQEPVAGVIQLSLVLRDRLFADMELRDWEAVISPKIQGTWNLHNALSQQPLDFFVLFSSFGGLIGQRGQGNYAAASTFLDAFVQFRRGQGLSASVLDVGAVADVGFLAERPDLVRAFRTDGYMLLRERDVLDSLELAIKTSLPSEPDTSDTFVSHGQLALGLGSTILLSSPQNRVVWRRDALFSFYHNIEAGEAAAGREADLIQGDADGGGNSGGDDDESTRLRRLLQTVARNPGILNQEAFLERFARSIGLAFFNFIMKPAQELDISINLTASGMDSLVAIELRNWLRRNLSIDMSVMEIVRSDSLLGLAKLGAKKWAAIVAAKP
ncbi:KR domain-containing protein [Xylariaceae sp. FL0804]|nr:KR domain-containing protein [Xylariaceae sp. FL0804]